MSDTFLPGRGFDTYESQDKVLVQMDGSRALPWRALPCGWQQNRPPMRKTPKRQQRPLASSASC